MSFNQALQFAEDRKLIIAEGQHCRCDAEQREWLPPTPHRLCGFCRGSAAGERPLGNLTNGPYALLLRAFHTREPRCCLCDILRFFLFEKGNGKQEFV